MKTVLPRLLLGLLAMFLVTQQTAVADGETNTEWQRWKDLAGYPEHRLVYRADKGAGGGVACDVEVKFWVTSPAIQGLKVKLRVVAQDGKIYEPEVIMKKKKDGVKGLYVTSTWRCPSGMVKSVECTKSEFIR